MRGYLRSGALYLGKCGGLALLYYVVGRVGRSIDFAQENTRVLLPQAGVALAGLLLFGIRCWPGVFLGSVLVTRLSGVPMPVPLTLGFALANSLSSVAGTWLLQRQGFSNGLRRLHDIYALLLFGVILAPFLNATVAVAIYAAQRGSDPMEIWQLWGARWFGQGISNLVLAPALLVWARPLSSNWGLRRVLEGIFLLAALGLVAQGVFTGTSAIRTLNYPLSFAPFPLVVWSAIRFGPRGAATATLLVAAAAIYGLSNGQGPFLRLAPDQPLVILQVYIMAVAISALFLASAIAERESSEAALLETQAQLRALSGRLEASREEERTRISREIHDELGQVLTGLKMGLYGLAKKLPEQDGELSRKAEGLLKLSDEAVGAVRRIATDLRPGILDDLGLHESLQWLVSDFAERTGMRAEFRNGAEGVAVNRDQSTALFRIAQEALTNVVRHADAGAVDVMLETRNNLLQLTVQDDGVGLPQEGARRGSLGLVGMRERATLLGGSLEVTARNDGHSGTCVTARIPL